MSGFGHHGEVRLLFEQRFEARADYGVIVSDEDAQWGH